MTISVRVTVVSFRSYRPYVYLLRRPLRRDDPTCWDSWSQFEKDNAVFSPQWDTYTSVEINRIKVYIWKMTWYSEMKIDDGYYLDRDLPLLIPLNDDTTPLISNVSHNPNGLSSNISKINSDILQEYTIMWFSKVKLRLLSQYSELKWHQITIIVFMSFWLPYNPPLIWEKGRVFFFALCL